MYHICPPCIRTRRQGSPSCRLLHEISDLQQPLCRDEGSTPEHTDIQLVSGGAGMTPPGKLGLSLAAGRCACKVILGLDLQDLKANDEPPQDHVLNTLSFQPRFFLGVVEVVVTKSTHCVALELCV